ncbi:MAG TPA: diadenylate cyclase CdaA [Phycisphaerae bacterium]|nr:diadenylate cyclase CdaA [Phycisphaerae bacterium]
MVDFLRNLLERLTAYPWWQTAIEFLLIGTVVYIVLEFLRGTRGARLIKGTVLFFVVVYTIVFLAGEKLLRVEYLFSRLLVFASFAVVVVFQPELRRALIRLGEARFFRGSSSTSRRLIDALCRSAEYCSRNRIGAIIAVERDVGLGTLIEQGGTPINAEVTAELLNTIFWPGSMLHDMGVVIRDGKIAAAGVQFPMVEGENLSPEMGARHRAGLGLSQETDALVIIVSEETGIISVAERGRLTRELTPEQLREVLTSSLQQSEAAEEMHHSAA